MSQQESISQTQLSDVGEYTQKGAFQELDTDNIHTRRCAGSTKAEENPKKSLQPAKSKQIGEIANCYMRIDTATEFQ